ncbi:carbohydrate kinase [Chromatiales bacterium (ex Bugula neritina AB1)]|nr:carbohydrate kinase [Chromatiales bacterium (ex Bugula neritina AB1)]
MHYMGIDVGTSGVRALVIDDAANVIDSSRSAMAEHGENTRDPNVWWQAVQAAISQLGNVSAIQSISIDATSGTVLPITADGRPLADALMYNDAVEDPELLGRIAALAPLDTAVHGASSALARAMVLLQNHSPARVVHQADWIVGQLTGRYDISDESNTLKTGYDPIQRRWPEWLTDNLISGNKLPGVANAGAITGTVQGKAAKQLKLPGNIKVVAGVTDGCASFLATGASNTGDCVTALGTTVTMKMLCDKPLFNAHYGVYSHRIGDRWLAGGASNSGGNVLLNFFTAEEIATLSARIDPQTEGGLGYYPLLKAGERFPHNDADWQPRLTPRPESDTEFLHGMFEGIAAIEALGYNRLAELGAPPPVSMRSVGGGADNPQWTAIRQRHLKTPFIEPLSTEAAMGSAIIARDAMRSL